MAAEGSYNPATKVLTVTGNGLPTPVTNGTFPNANNANTISAYTFNHAFTYRGGENTSNSGSFSVGIVGIAGYCWGLLGIVGYYWVLLVLLVFLVLMGV